MWRKLHAENNFTLQAAARGITKMREESLSGAPTVHDKKHPLSPFSSVLILQKTPRDCSEFRPLVESHALSCFHPFVVLSISVMATVSLAETGFARSSPAAGRPA